MYFENRELFYNEYLIVYTNSLDICNIGVQNIVTRMYQHFVEKTNDLHVLFVLY